ncbi:SBBP repeat-containing protein, partial [Steroidobacter sp.]|uniref:SBBP repeat-containing protein n=1 Tax=Steroidobacter sp. TaxID=1978227 RepID=UPI001A416C81
SGASAVFFVTKIDPSQRTLIYSTFVTDTGRTAKPTDWRAEWGLGHIAGLAVDGAGRACIVGGTSLTDYPVVRPVQATLRGESDGFVTQLDPTGSSLTFSTYLGGSGLDDFEDVAVDAKGNVFVTGLTQSTDFPLVKPLQASFGGPDYDIVVLKLTPQAESRKSFSAKYSR